MPFIPAALLPLVIGGATGAVAGGIKGGAKGALIGGGLGAAGGGISSAASGSLGSILSKGVGSLGGAIGGVPGSSPLPPGVEGPVQAGGSSLLQTILKAGLPIGGTILGSILGGKQTGTEKDVLASLLVDRETSRKAGGELIEAGRTSVAAPQQYWQRILSGDRGEMTSAIAPEIADINDRYDRTFQSTRELYPRGGGTTAQASSLPFEKARAITSLYQALRPDAAKNLATLGTNQTSLGSGLLNNSTGVGSSILGYEGGRRESATQMGTGIGSILARILFAPKEARA